MWSRYTFTSSIAAFINACANCFLYSARAVIELANVGFICSIPSNPNTHGGRGGILFPVLFFRSGYVSYIKPNVIGAMQSFSDQVRLLLATHLI